ncbi:ATP-dependent helicase [Salinisphaera sp. P385]|uniref:DNA 3'-5' helicase n=1 Tax=Spectribacter acetivorans TaxID=3075603 RepID=A0ABU3B8W0_9GAMM|nr:ATP-dependent helicase [Salinisphaera sp. P385]MDT0618510.1 ATP-dependent helicase [Salinisphaera sp. P385]
MGYQGLTQEQLAVVHHEQGHARVSAVAGSGKTHTMVHRIAHLLDRGVDPRRILALMFNRDAAEQFARRLREHVERDVRLPEVLTFHAFGRRLTRHFVDNRWLRRATLQTEAWRLHHLAREVLRAENGANPSADDLEAFLGYIDLVKSDLLAPDIKFDQLYANDPNQGSYIRFPQAFERFEQTRTDNRWRFFADLIYDPVMAVQRGKTQPRVLANRYDHIIVDEYQDVNEIQHHLIQSLAGDRASVMAVGDVDQCIYVWRGANPRYITHQFEQSFPGARTYLLSHTFRYGHALSLAANNCVTHNTLRDDKLCISAPANPPTTLRLESYDDRPGASGHSPVPALIDQWRAGGGCYRDIAVLVRLFSMAAPIEIALLEHGIPYRLVGSRSVFEAEGYQMLTGYLYLATGRYRELDPQQWRERIRVMLTHPTIGLHDGLDPVIDSLAAEPESSDRVFAQLLAGQHPSWRADRIEQRRALFADAYHGRLGARAADVLRNIDLRLALRNYYQSTSANRDAAEDRYRLIQAITRLSGNGQPSPAGLIDYLAPLESRDHHAPDGDAVLITSVHRAKGLEWPMVILPSLEEGGFPAASAADDPDKIEDERRLFYVAMTRAQKMLCLLHPVDDPFSFIHANSLGRHHPDSRVSRFLTEAQIGVSGRVGEAIHEGASPKVPAHNPATMDRYLGEIGLDWRLTRPKPTASARKLFGRPDPLTPEMQRLKETGSRYPVGATLYHPKYGMGLITDTSANYVSARFPGEKKTRSFQIEKAEKAGLKLA